MKSVTEIISKYTSGEATLEETNEALQEAQTGYYLDPNKNTITEAEMRQTTVGHFPDQANGWGMLDTGTGSMDKVQVKNGELVNMDCGNTYAILFIAGKQYEVEGRKVVEYDGIDSNAKKTKVLPMTPDMSRRNDLAGQTVVQKTGSGKFAVTYDEIGYAVKATRVTEG